MLLEISKSDIAFGIRVSEFNTETLKETNQDVMHYDILIIYKPHNNLSLNFDPFYIIEEIWLNIY
uniref:Uncharacterized protein n=1 Tax=Rhizophagus irregularis (strain DAOM 181602 / DAOM 197198 / MUCL 43194) TaxID=747089 RepID=U9U246_RHIID